MCVLIRCWAMIKDLSEISVDGSACVAWGEWWPAGGNTAELDFGITRCCWRRPSGWLPLMSCVYCLGPPSQWLGRHKDFTGCSQHSVGRPGCGDRNSQIIFGRSQTSKWDMMLVWDLPMSDEISHIYHGCSHDIISIQSGNWGTSYQCPILIDGSSHSNMDVPYTWWEYPCLVSVLWNSWKFCAVLSL